LPGTQSAHLLDDRLGYGDYARAPADALGGMVPQRGLVVAINGPWGSGKSTIMGFLRHFLEEHDPETIVLEFNPWVFSGRDDLLASYLGALIAAVDRRWGRGLAGRLRRPPGEGTSRARANGSPAHARLRKVSP
jgi:predicted KAP-like P-loop ATPase